MTTLYSLAADAVLILHACFVMFVVAGGFLLLRSQRWLYWHLPAVTWGVLIEWMNWSCPLTHVEWYLRAAAGESPDKVSLLGRVLTALIYPDFYDRTTQILLGILVVIINSIVYAKVFIKRNKIRNSP